MNEKTAIRAKNDLIIILTSTINYTSPFPSGGGAGTILFLFPGKYVRTGLKKKGGAVIKIKTSFKVNYSVQCPSCKEKFPASPSPDGIGGRCPRCGAAVNVPPGVLKNSGIDANTFGAITPGGAATYVKARLLARVVNVIGVVMAVWTALLPLPYKAAVMAAAVMPLAALLVAVFSRGAIRLAEVSKEKVPHVAYAAIAPAAALAFRATFFRVLEERPLLLPVLAVAVPLAAVSFRFVKAAAWNYVFIVFFVLLYGFGAAMEANCLLDRSVPAVYEVAVAGKHKTGGGARRTASYYLSVGPWRARKEINDVEVSRRAYNDVNPGDHVTVSTKLGYLDIPWYYVRKR